MVSSLLRAEKALRCLGLLVLTYCPVSIVVCGQVSDGNECVVVSGALTLYSSDSESAQASEDAITSSIQDSMSSGSFDSVTDEVVRVSYVDLQSDSNNEARAPNDADNSAIGDGNSPVLIGILVAAGVVLAAGLGVAYKKRSSAAEDGAATEFGETSTMTPQPQS